MFGRAATVLNSRQYIFSSLRILMNGFPVVGDVFYLKSILGSPGGKHCKWLYGNARRPV